MAEVTTRIELKEYCLRKLGFPVIEINVADDQMEDRLDDALQYFNEWHFDGAEKIYMKHQVTATVLTFAAPVPVGTFKKGEQITGSISKTTALIWDQSATNTSVRIHQASGRFVDGETITSTYASTTLAATNAIVLGDLDEQFIPVPHTVMSVSRIFPISATLTSNYLFDPVYYHAFDLMYNFNGLDLVSYEMLKERINLINEMLVGQKPVRFNRHMEKLFIDFDWKKSVIPDAWLIIECTRILDPEQYTNVYNNFFLKEYATALFQIQWGQNLSKFASIQLPGGVTLDGPRILEEGKAKKAELEEQMKSGRWCEPLGVYVG